MSVFEEQAEQTISTWLPILSSGLYGAQQGGLLAVKAHFITSDQPAIVSMPTGTGKTELMMALAFLLQAKRVLVVEPTQVLRSQTCERFSSLDILRDIGLIPNGIPDPLVNSQDTICDTVEDWEHLKDYDVTVALPNSISPRHSGVIPPPDSTVFDLVFFDEAHHTASSTWFELLNIFPNARKVLLSATPFRRDRRRLPGKLVYHYSIGRALDEGLYREVEFSAVAYEADQDNLNRNIAHKANDIFATERKLNNRPRMLIKARHISQAEHLVAFYDDLGLRIATVHSHKDDSENESNIEALRSGNLDGIIAVGMLGEGLNIPDIKIAVLHDPPQSLPFTVQLVGRVSRNPAEQTGPAHLVAVPEKVHGEVRALYWEDEDWRRLIPALVDEVLDREYPTHESPDDHVPRLPINPHFLEPFFVARLYAHTEDWEGLKTDFNLEDLTKYPSLPHYVKAIYHLPAPTFDGLIILISEIERSPRWASRSGLLETHFDLHIIYNPVSFNHLITATTRDEVCTPIRKKLAPDISTIEPEHLGGVLDGFDEYVNLGLKNATGLTGSHPAYRVHLGHGSGTSLRPSDAVAFGAGHAMARIRDEADEVVRGIATGSRKIWEMRRDRLEEFVLWCNQIGHQVSEARETLPGLDSLTFPRKVFGIDEKPMAILLDDSLAWEPEVLRVQDVNDTLKPDIWPQMLPVTLRENELQVNLNWHTQYAPLKLSYDPTREELWRHDDEREAKILLDGEIALQDHLSANPPTLVMPSSGVIQGDIQWRLINELASPPAYIFQALDWNECEITAEESSQFPGRKSVHEATENFLLTNDTENTILIKDHGANEISDYVFIDLENRTIRFVHCKASSKDFSGCRQLDLGELLHQCCRSHAWVRQQDLISILATRLEDRQDTQIMHGSNSLLDYICSNYKRNQWSFEVIAVQPGLSIHKLLHTGWGKTVLGLITTTYEWLQQAHANLVVWGGEVISPNPSQ